MSRQQRVSVKAIWEFSVIGCDWREKSCQSYLQKNESTIDAL